MAPRGRERAPEQLPQWLDWFFALLCGARVAPDATHSLITTQSWRRNSYVDSASNLQQTFARQNVPDKQDSQSNSHRSAETFCHMALYSYKLALASVVLAVLLVPHAALAQQLTKWIYRTGDLIRSSPVLGPDGTLYATSNDGNIYAISMVDGSVKWTRAIITGPGYTLLLSSSPPFGSDGILYAYSHYDNMESITEGIIHAIVTVGNRAFATGSVKWTCKTRSRVSSSPVLGPNGTLYAGSKDGSIYAIDTVGNSTVAAGSVKWTYKNSNQVYLCTVLGPDGTLYAASIDRKVYAIVTVGNSTVAAGSVKWMIVTNSMISSPPVLGPDGILYVGSNLGEVYAIDTVGNSAVAAGSVKWTSLVGSSVSSSPALDPGGILYVGSSSSSIVSAIVTVGNNSIAAGSVKWTFKTLAPVSSSPVLGPDGTLYVASNEGKLYAIDTVGNSTVAAGSTKWIYQIGGAVFLSPVLGPDGTVYAGTLSGSIHAILTTNFRCPPGFYFSSLSCVLCSPGYFCLDADISMSACRMGYYCPGSGLSSPVTCPPGGFCPFEFMSSPRLCAAGTFSPQLGAVSEYTCQACNSGNYCPQGSARSIPCPAGRYFPSFNATKSSDCLVCPRDTFSLSGSSSCTKCGSDQSSGEGAETCDPCLPSAFSISKFKCYSDAAKVLVVGGWVVSLISSLFSIYKLRNIVLERIKTLKAAGIWPSLKNIIFIESALRDNPNRMMLSLGEAEESDGTSLSLSEAKPSSNEGFAQIVSTLETQFQQQQQVNHDRICQMEIQLQQQHQQMALVQRQYQELQTLLHQMQPSA